MKDSERRRAILATQSSDSFEVFVYKDCDSIRKCQNTCFKPSNSNNKNTTRKTEKNWKITLKSKELFICLLLAFQDINSESVLFASLHGSYCSFIATILLCYLVAVRWCRLFPHTVFTFLNYPQEHPYAILRSLFFLGRLLQRMTRVVRLLRYSCRSRCNLRNPSRTASSTPIRLVVDFCIRIQRRTALSFELFRCSNSCSQRRCYYC